MNEQELEDIVNRYVGMAILKNDRNYSWDILKVFEAHTAKAVLDARIDEIKWAMKRPHGGQADIHELNSRQSDLQTQRNALDKREDL